MPRSEGKWTKEVVPTWFSNKETFDKLLTRTRKMNPLDVFGPMAPIKAFDQDFHYNMIWCKSHPEWRDPQFVREKQERLLRSGSYWKNVKLGKREFKDYDEKLNINKHINF